MWKHYLTSPAPRKSTLCSVMGLPMALCAANRPARATDAVPGHMHEKMVVNNAVTLLDELKWRRTVSWVKNIHNLQEKKVLF